MAAKPGSPVSSRPLPVDSSAASTKRPKTTTDEEVQGLRLRVEAVEKENQSLRAEVASLKIHLKEALDAVRQRDELHGTKKTLEEMVNRTKTEISGMHVRMENLEKQKPANRYCALKINNQDDAAKAR